MRFQKHYMSNLPDKSRQFNPNWSFKKKAEYWEEQAAKEEREKKGEFVPVDLGFRFPEIYRAIPNCVVKSALFGVVKKGARKYCKELEIASWRGNRLIYSGQQLDQNDLDVWLEVVNMSLTNVGPAHAVERGAPEEQLIGRSRSGPGHTGARHE
jgi:hypothetical protein